MVLKFGKRGVVSGNTLKTPSTRAFRTYRKNAYIVREDTTLRGEDVTGNTFGVDDLQETSVPYSLNKKGRWLLPTKLMNAIKQGEFHFEDYGVQLIEKHNINKRANCVSAFFSKGPVRQVTVFKRNDKQRKKGSGYMSLKSIKNTNSGIPNRRKRRSVKRGLPTVRDTQSQAPTNNQVTFEVVYPSPSSSSLTHNPKYIGFDMYKTKQVAKHQRLRRTNQDIIQFDVSGLDNEDELSEDDDVSDTYFPKTEKRSDTVDIQAYITQAISRKALKLKQPSESLFVPELEDFEFIEAEDRPVRVILQHSDTDPKTLSSCYDRRYVECGCYPRKFIIDISDDVQSFPVFTEHWKESLKQVQACVVFVYDVDNEINTTEDGIYNVHLNTSFANDMMNTKIETLFDYTEANVAECLARALFYVETLPDLVQPYDSERAGSKINTKHSVFDTEYQSYIPNETFHYKSFISSCQLDDDIETSCFDGNSMFSSDEKTLARPHGQICAICFDDIRTDIPGTALENCGHWFCNNCWRDHLTSKVKSGCTRIDCPEFACKGTVDKGTLMSLVCLEDVIKLTKITHDATIDRQDETKWCPNSRCGRVLQVEGSAVAMVHCDCGQSVCFQCLGPAHWPAPCQSARVYEGIKHDLGLTDGRFDPDLVSVNGMTCPHCKQFFEKIDGCPYMYCLCGKSFCWGCGKDWETNTHGRRCEVVGYNQVNDKTIHKFVFGHDLENDWVNAALQHQMDQWPVKVVALKCQSQQIARELSIYLNKTHNDIPLGFKGTRRGYTKESQKIPEF